MKPREAVHPVSFSWKFPPHFIFFLLYNIVYLGPLVAVYFWGYSEGGAGTVATTSGKTIQTILLTYVSGSLAFSVGSLVVGRVCHALPAAACAWRPNWHTLRGSDKLFIVVLVTVFVASKVSLISLGVYNSYAFDTGQMTGGLWGFSMYCSESMLLVSVLVLFSDSKWNVRGFIVLAVINSINLLHGTRIFFIITIIITCLYAYIRGYLPWRRIIVLGPLAASLVLGMAYFTFLSRSGLSAEGAFSFQKIISPIMFESLFSQLSLINISTDPSTWDMEGHVLEFFRDVTLNATPRFLLEDKDALQFFSDYSYLSPLGAFNGYAAGLIYFGVFMPVFYACLGGVGSLLFFKARASSWWFVFYVYFTADFLFRIMRDGYAIPLKMIINMIQILVVLFVFRLVLRALGNRPRQVAAKASWIRDPGETLPISHSPGE